MIVQNGEIDESPYVTEKMNIEKLMTYFAALLVVLLAILSTTSCGTGVLSHPPEATCGKADGVCGSSCNANTDPDCQPICGNAIVESGETCDPPASCGASQCASSNPCINAVSQGSVSQCNISCTVSLVTVCRANDGCCPEECNVTNDMDCSGTCGNGTIDANETCDPLESCPIACDDSDPCTEDTLVGSAANCNAACVSAPIVPCCIPSWTDVSACNCSPTPCAPCTGLKEQSDNCGVTQAVECTLPASGCGTICCGSTCCAADAYCDSGACRVPSCTDGIQNGSETGIDCGGSCPACFVLESIEVGPEEVVVSFPICEADDISDASTRAFVDASGRVNLFAVHNKAYIMLGDNLEDVTRDCSHAVMGSHQDQDPAHYNSSEWLVAPYTLDGTTVYSLVHNEYYGYNNNNCSSVPPAAYINCWWNSVTLAVSTNAGYSYDHATPPGHLVMATAGGYDPNNIGWHGYFEPTNVIAHGGYYYFYALYGSGNTIVSENCLARTSNLGDPGAYRFWSGSGDLSTGFTWGPGPSDCGKISSMGAMHGNVSYNRYLKRFIVVGPRRTIVPGSVTYDGIYIRTSTNLLNWSEPPHLVASVTLAGTGAVGGDQYAYPSLLQPGDESRNFEITDRSPYLYLVKWPAGQDNYHRQLVRRRIHFNLAGESSKRQMLAMEFSERRGTKTLDSSFAGNNGALSGNASLAAIDSRQVVNMGTGGRVTVPHAASISARGAMTIEARIRIPAATAEFQTIVAKEDLTPASRNFSLFLTPNSFTPAGVLGFSLKDWVGDVAVTSVTDNQWHHVAVTFTDSEQIVRFYVDGRLDATKALVGSTLAAGENGHPLTMGSVPLGAWLTGYIDRVRIYDYALTGAEIAVKSNE